MFSAAVGASGCDKCPHGKFSAAPGQTGCTFAVEANGAGVVTSHDVIAVATGIQIALLSTVGFELVRAPFRRAVADSVGGGTSWSAVIITDVRRGAHALDPAQPSAARRLLQAVPQHALGVEVDFEVHMGAGAVAEVARVSAQLRQLGNGTAPAAALVGSFEGHMRTDGKQPPPGMRAVLVRPVRREPAVCVKGHFFEYKGPTMAGRCAVCPAGKHKHSVGSADARCQSCAAGRYIARNASAACVGCRVGRANPELGATAAANCSVCAAGQSSGRFAEASPLCEACAAGRSQSDREQAVCEQCDTGRFSPETGAAACKVCDTMGALGGGAIGGASGSMDADRTTCKPNATFALGVVLCGVAVFLLCCFAWYFGRGERGFCSMAFRKQRMILSSSADFFTDGFYISTATFVSHTVKMASLGALLAPTMIFVIVRRGVIRKHVGLLRERFIEKTDEREPNSLHNCMAYLWFKLWWMTSICVLYPIALVLVSQSPLPRVLRASHACD